MWDLLLTRARVATMDGAAAYGLIEDGAVAVEGERIAWAGSRRDLPAGASARREIDCGDGCITPGLVDPHTHAVYGGNRAAEFEQRLRGATYEEIAGAAAASCPPCARPGRRRRRAARRRDAAPRAAAR